MEKRPPRETPLPLPEIDLPTIVEPGYQELAPAIRYGMYEYGATVRITAYDPSELPENDRRKLEAMWEAEKKRNDLDWLLQDAEEAAQRFFDKRREKQSVEAKEHGTPSEKAKECCAKALHHHAHLVRWDCSEELVEAYEKEYEKKYTGAIPKEVVKTAVKTLIRQAALHGYWLGRVVEQAQTFRFAPLVKRSRR